MKTVSLLVPCFMILLTCEDIFAKQGFFWYNGHGTSREDTFWKMLYCLANNAEDCLNTWSINKGRIPDISDALKEIKPNVDLKGHITGVKLPEIKEKQGSAPMIKIMFEKLKKQFSEYLQKVENIPELKQKLETEVEQRHAGATPNDVQEIVKGIVESHFIVDLLRPWIDILKHYLKLIPDVTMPGVKRLEAVEEVITTFENVEKKYNAKNFDWPDTNFGWLGEADSTATVVSG